MGKANGFFWVGIPVPKNFFFGLGQLGANVKLGFVIPGKESQTCAYMYVSDVREHGSIRRRADRCVDKNNPIIEEAAGPIGSRKNGEKVAIAFELAADVDLRRRPLKSRCLKCFA